MNHKVRCLFAQEITSLTVYRFKQYTAPATTISTATSGSGGTISGSQSAATVVKVTRGAYSWGALVWRSGWFLCFLSSSSLLGWHRTRRRRRVWALVQSLRRECKMLSLQVLLLGLSFPFLFSFYVRHAGSSSRENSASPTDCSYFEGTTASYTLNFYFPAKAERSLFF